MFVYYVQVFTSVVHTPCISLYTEVSDHSLSVLGVLSVAEFTEVHTESHNVT